MTSIIKNQLLKHLSRYTKNLSSDKINLSTFRGEGELSNLQLDEEVLTELLELPSWLKLTSAWCNHVSFRIHWTKLKSTPITLTLDEVRITVETCDLNSRNPSTPATPAGGIQALTGPQGKYSFINKVIDGITIIVNNVNVNFASPAFTASIQMSRIRVESKTPKWLLGDLRVTRLKDPVRGLILIFKELSWQTVRIEASSTQDKTLTPLRLLTNQARCRITIKKKLSDCSVLASRLVLILDDLLWVLTDSQLKAALHFVDSLSGLIKLSTNAVQRKKAQRKLETLPENQALIAQQSNSSDANVATMNAAQKSFAVFDVKETSYHFFSQRIDLHLCDDAGDGRSCHPSLKEGGALQVSVQGFQVDYYPYHLAKANRINWPKYKEASVPPALWLEQSLNAFKESLLNLSTPNRPSSHAPLERTPINQFSPTASNEPLSILSTPNTQNTSMPSSPMKKHVLDNLAKLMTSCVILRVEDFQLYRVTTTGKKQMPKEFISGDKDRYSFPQELPSLHAEFTYFYYPGDFVFPLPPSKVFVHMNPIQVNFDLDSCLWFSSFALNLHESLLKTSVADTINTGSPTVTVGNAAQAEPSLMYMDVKLESIMPRVVFEANPDAPSQRDRPKTMVIQVSRFAITNIREMGSSRADLAQALHSLQEGSLVFGSEFPSKNSDMCIVTDRLLSHVSATDVIPTALQPISSPGTIQQTPFSHLTRYALWVEPRDIWCIKLDPVWIDFFGARSIGPNRSIPFIDAVPVTIWLHGRSEFDSKKLNEQLLNVHKGKTLSFDDVQSGGGGGGGGIVPNKKSTQLHNESLILSVTNLQSIDNNNLELNILPQYTKVTTNSVDRIYSNNRIYASNNDDDTTNSSSENTKIPSSLNINEDDDVYEETTNTADMHIIAHVSNLVSIQIDHYQYLFLLRLSEELTELATFLSLDTKRIMNIKDNLDKSMVIGCVIPQVEITLVMPSQTPGKELSGGDGESVLPDSASLGDDLHMNSTSSVLWPSQTPPSLDLLKNTNPFNSSGGNGGDGQTPSPSLQNQSFDIIQTYTSNPNTHGYNVQIQSEPQSMLNSLSKSSRSNRAVSGSGDTSLAKEINSAFPSMKSMKKGFSSIMTSIDSALKTNQSGMDDTSDTFSIHSDISSDSDNYIMVLDSEKTADCMDVMFKLNPFAVDNNLKASPVEMASEVLEEQQYKTNMSSPSEPSEASSCKRRDLVSMVTFRLTTVELIRQNQGYSSSLRLQVAAVNCDECSAIPWDEFQSKFGTRCRAWNIANYNSEASPAIKIRLDESLNPPDDLENIVDRKSVLDWFNHKVDVRAKDLNLQLSMSTVIGLGDLAEDEIIPKALPLELYLENLRINLIEDRPPVNITSPGAMPINLHIGKMKIMRDESGVFHIQPDSSLATTITENNNTNSSFEEEHTLRREKDRDRELLSLQLIMQQMKLDNDNLRRQVVAAERHNEGNKTKSQQENDILKGFLKAAQDDISTLLDEKRTLLDTVRSLQQQLMTTDKLYKSDGNR